MAIVGTGLTAVDTVLALESQRFTGSYTLISRKAQLPQPHLDVQPAISTVQDVIDQLRSALSLRQLLRVFRNAVKDGKSWQAVMDAFRPYTQDRWRQLALRDKRKFLSSLRSYWDSHRHRIPRSSFAIINTLKNEGRLTVLQGHVLGCSTVKEKSWLEIASRKEPLGPFDHCFNCMGPWFNLRSCGDPFITSLITQNLASYDKLNLGLRADMSGAVMNQDGQVVTGLYILGPLRRGELWETTAVREIRQQAYIIAKKIVDIIAKQGSESHKYRQTLGAYSE